MNTPRLNHAQLKRFSQCLDVLYGSPNGEDPIEAVLRVLGDVTHINSMAVDEFKLSPTGRLAHKHVTSVGFEGHPEVAVIPQLVMKDHPIIKHAVKVIGSEPLRISDFVSQRELRKLSIFDYNNKIHEGWCDQIALRTRVAGGTMNITLNRDQVFTDEEFFLFDLLMPHIRRVLGRCALFMRLPGNDQLTPREREILYWMTKGKRDDEIAQIVRSSPRTVNKQVQAIISKLGVENRTSAVALVLTR